MTRQVAFIWGGVALLLIALSPWAAQIAGSLWECSFREYTGFACPTCGSARSALLLADFEFMPALVRYPLPTLGWLVFLGGGLAALALTLLGRPVPGVPRSLPGWARLAIVSAVLVNWAYSVATGV